MLTLINYNLKNKQSSKINYFDICDFKYCILVLLKSLITIANVITLRYQ